MDEGTAHADLILVDIVTGFLGAGKTTFINKMLAQGYGNNKVALIENEFGDVAIDDDILAGQGMEIRTMATGCICCTLKGDFERNLAEIVAAFDLERIIIEPTGLANLADMVGVVQACAKTLPLKLNSIITVVNAETLLPMLSIGGQFFIDQLEQARIVVLSCVQLVEDEEDLEDTLSTLHETCMPGTPIIDALWEDVDALELVGLAEEALLAYDRAHGALDERLLDEHEHDHSHDHDHEHEHGHESHHKDANTGCESLAFSPTRAFSVEELDALGKTLVSSSVGEVLRAKGFVMLDASAVLFELVYGRFDYKPTMYSGKPKFVVIGRDLDKQAIANLLER